MTNTVLLSGVLSVKVGDGVSSVAIKGRWAQPGESSYQQFRLSRTGEPGGELLDGEEHSFSGSFDFDGGVVEENGVKISFEKTDEGTFALRGRGNNGIGAFLLQGTATPSPSDSTYNVELEKYYIGVGDRVARYRSGNGEAPRILTGEISHGQEGGSCYKVFDYKDGTVEEMDGKDIVEKFIFIDKEGHPNKATCREKSFKKGLGVLMYFLVQDEPKPYSGKVTRYDAEADLYSILFEDGEELKLEPEIVAEIVVSKCKGPKPIRTKKKATQGNTCRSAPPSKRRGSENKDQAPVTASDKADKGVNVSSEQTNVDVAGVDATEDEVAVDPKKASVVLDSSMKTSLVSTEDAEVEMEQDVDVTAEDATKDGDIVASKKVRAFIPSNDGTVKAEDTEKKMTAPPTVLNEAVDSVEALQSELLRIEKCTSHLQSKSRDLEARHNELRTELDVQSSKIASSEKHSLEEANRHDKMESEQQRLNGAINTVSADHRSTQAKLGRVENRLQTSETLLLNQGTIVGNNCAVITGLTSRTEIIGENMVRVSKILPNHARRLDETQDALQELQESCARSDDSTKKELQRLNDENQERLSEVSALSQEVSSIAKNTEANTEDIEALKVGHKTLTTQWRRQEEQQKRQKEERNHQENCRNHAIQRFQSELPWIRGDLHDQRHRVAYLEATVSQITSLLSSTNSSTYASTSGQRVAVVDPDPNHSAANRKKPSADGGGAPSNPNKKSRKLVWGATIRSEPS